MVLLQSRAAPGSMMTCPARCSYPGGAACDNLYCRRVPRVALSVEPQSASGGVSGSPGQVNLTEFLNHAEAAAAPRMAAIDGLLPVELTVGLAESRH